MGSQHLSVSQKLLLQRLVAGEVVTRRSTPELATSVYALRSRGLVVTVKGKAGDWTATLTLDGVTAADTGVMPAASPSPRGRAREPETERPAQHAETVVVPAPTVVSSTIQRRTATPARLHATGSSAPPSEATATPPRSSDPARIAVQTTRASLKGAADEKGLLRSSGQGSVPVLVGRSSIPRAMAVLSAIFTAAREAGGGIELERRRDQLDARHIPPRTVLVFDGHQYGFSVVEEADRRPHEPTKAELAQKARYSWTRIPQWDYYPSGRLVVRLDDTYNRSRTARSRFGDGKRAQAEDKIADMVAELVERARLATEQRREAMRLDDLYAQERVAGVERAKLHYLEDLRARAAAEHAERWHQAERLRAYAEAMRKRPHNEGTDAWLDWITTRADRLDPPDLVPASPQLPEDIPEHQIHDYLRAWPQSRPYHWQPTE